MKRWIVQHSPVVSTDWRRSCHSKEDIPLVTMLLGVHGNGESHWRPTESINFGRLMSSFPPSHCIKFLPYVSTLSRTSGLGKTSWSVPSSSTVRLPWSALSPSMSWTFTEEILGILPLFRLGTLALLHLLVALLLNSTDARKFGQEWPGCSTHYSCRRSN